MSAENLSRRESSPQPSEEGWEHSVVGAETDETRELARQFHIRKLRSPYIRAFFQFVRTTPHLWDQFQERYQLRDEFGAVAQELEAEDDVEIITSSEHIKRLKPLWSAMATIPEAKVYFELMLDEASRAESDGLKNHLREAPRYVPELIIGAGLHSAIYNTELLQHAPGVARLTVDVAERLGGQFRQYGGPAISMNTPNRARNIDTPHILDNPNTNSFGPHAPVQLTDVSGEFYANNDQVGLVSAINQYLASDTLLGTHVVEVSKNTDPLALPGKYRVRMEDSQTGETYTITTDKVVASTGLGTPDFGFRDMDEATRELCSADDGRVQTYGQFLSELGDRSNPFPLKRYVNKRVLIIGGGNSGLTVAEGLAGLAPEYRGSVSSLGGPSQITILGTKFTDDKSFISTEIPRYAQLASLMRKAGPAADANTRSQLVVPVTGVRAVRLSEKNMSSSGNELPPIIVHCEEKGGGTGGKDMEADIVIVTTGFTTEQHQIFKNLLPPDSTASTTFSENLEDMRVAESSHPVGRNLKGEKDIVFIGPAADMPINDREKKAADLFNRSRSAVALPNTAEDTLWYARAMVGEEVRKGERREAPWLHETSGPQTTIETGSFTELSFVISADTSEERLPPEIRYEELLRLSKLSHTPRAITSPREPFETTLQVEQVDGQQYKITSDTPIPGSYKQMLTDFLADTYTQVAILRLLDKRHSHGRPLRISFPD